MIFTADARILFLCTASVFFSFASLVISSVYEHTLANTLACYLSLVLGGFVFLGMAIIIEFLDGETKEIGCEA